MSQLQQVSDPSNLKSVRFQWRYSCWTGHAGHSGIGDVTCGTNYSTIQNSNWYATCNPY